jgi:penicillin amidase
LQAPVTVLRDKQGVPRVYADSAEDLFLAQGFIHAQDRFFEMDYRRMVASGRLAEIVGDDPAAIASDTMVRTLGWRRIAHDEFDLLAPQTRTWLRAYADGVNAYLATRSPSRLAVEYLALSDLVATGDPEMWEPVDSLVWLKAMAWDMRGNYQDELYRALSYSTLQDVDLVEELFPPFEASGNTPILQPGDLLAPLNVSSANTVGRTVGSRAAGDAQRNHLTTGALTALSQAREAVSHVSRLVGYGDATGSNAFAVSGEHTASGAPLLANDPHLALTIPSPWTQMGLHCTTVSAECPFDVAGFGFAGFPGLMIGQNADLSWGLANLRADVTDFFVEQIRGDNVRQGNAWEPVSTHHETISVAGGDPVELTVRTAGGRPIISDVLGQEDTTAVAHSPGASPSALNQYAVSLDWTALSPGTTADAIFALNAAGSPEDVQAAAAAFSAPAQAIVFATAAGDIGFQAAGRIPQRAKVPGYGIPTDGSWPQDGQETATRWQGWLPAEQMPRALNPSDGFIIAANQAVLPTGKGPFLSRDWDYGFRSERVRTLLTEAIDSGEPITPATANTIQTDILSPGPTYVVPALLSVDVPSGFESDGQRLLRHWDGLMATDSAGAVFFAETWHHLLQLTFWDELPAKVRPDGGGRWLTVLIGMLEAHEDPFWDDRSTLNVVETRDEVLRQSLVAARQSLTQRVSKNPADWTWGALHQLELQHPVLGTDTRPFPVRHFANPPSVALPGSILTVNATSWDATAGSFAIHSGPSMRMVVDVGRPNASTWVNSTGASGHPASPHYRDQMHSWIAGETYPFLFTRTIVERAGVDMLTLTP